MSNFLTKTDVPFETDEADVLFRTNEENFSLKKRRLGVMSKDSPFYNLVTSLEELGEQHPAKGLKKRGFSYKLTEYSLDMRKTLMNSNMFMSYSSGTCLRSVDKLIVQLSIVFQLLKHQTLDEYWMLRAVKASAKLKKTEQNSVH
ncbi:hypothetical protein DY000_02058978 [Brassica cretica]|uniref:Uncharacterized protein n=1 Tax=Brassica cretica TaxID=69181 RepID=A0ABQ7AZI0_BRACR|nr:hypothetical protein DY000_02058978 [Brassica cretica]